MGWFSSTPKASSSTSAGGNTDNVPTRSARQACWSSRDAYYSCLTSKGIQVPPGTDITNEGKGPIGKAALEEQRKRGAVNVEEERSRDPCKHLRDGYEEHCARSWVEYFNKRKVLEERQKLMFAQGAIPAGSGPAPGAGPA
ncbi:hypothetical protein IE81DRAFT_323189 [Ceraceosorus guamensis]|uniref:Cytochrome c oxidase, subunit VIb n=1 Tax=Ceraceosorus guamensis TaxID=1522189 RepID=A0A316VYX1_9BASI|nr:hypothetical protein IE81DRAFT_323189 [Ceraceosorus guamensis]PWN42642.1 hypothetical protein IE81DRAFT_323189 [Ceraceosorus guamensis]